MSRLTHDINQYGVTIQPKSNTTLKAMTKAELIEYIRTLEHNYNVAVEFNERQARNVEAELKRGGMLIEQKHGNWIRTGAISYRCSECNYLPMETDTAYCPNCGAKMGEVESER